MDIIPKMEPGSSSWLPSTSSSHGNFEEMSVSDLVSLLRDSVLPGVSDRVEKTLVERDEALRAEIGSLRKKYKEERQLRLQNEQESGDMKQNYSLEKEKNDLLRNTRVQLWLENLEMMDQKVKWFDDLAKLRTRNGELEQHLATVEEKKAENEKLHLEEKGRHEEAVSLFAKKFDELHDRMKSLENDGKVLRSSDASSSSAPLEKKKRLNVLMLNLC